MKGYHAETDDTYDNIGLAGVELAGMLWTCIVGKSGTEYLLQHLQLARLAPLCPIWESDLFPAGREMHRPVPRCRTTTVEESKCT